MAKRAASACTSSLVGPLRLVLMLRRHMVCEGRVAGPRGCGEGRGLAQAGRAGGKRVDARQVTTRLLIEESCATTRRGCATVVLAQLCATRPTCLHDRLATAAKLRQGRGMSRRSDIHTGGMAARRACAKAGRGGVG